MVDTILEELVKTTFGDNWLYAMAVLVCACFAIKFMWNSSRLPGYIKKCLLICLIAGGALIEAELFQWNQQAWYPDVKLLVDILPYTLSVVMILSIGFLAYSYCKIDRQLKVVITNTEPQGDKIAAWKELQDIQVARLTPWQKKKYDKRRLYLRVFLGNMCGAEQELEKFSKDEAFYHYMKAILFNFKGNHKAEIEEAKLAEDACDGDTDSLLHFQIITNRGVAYVGAGEYRLAQDCFNKAINLGKKKNLSNPDLWLNIYYNYVFNITRLNPDISIKSCFDELEGVKNHIDIEDPKQYIGYSNIVIDILRQNNADREEINRIINLDFEYLVNSNLTDMERCALEATTARMVCTGRLDPNAVTERLSKDAKLFLQLPMPMKYRCLKEIDYMFKDLRGPITEKNRRIKEAAHLYIINQAIYDLEEYRASLPSEAVHEICYCLKERAGLLKYNEQRYDWNDFIITMQSVKRLYKENDLLADAVLCDLDIMDEATSELNIDSDLKSIHMDTMKASLKEIEEIIPELMEHPILNEIYLRLSIYCFAMDDIEKSREYYEKFQRLGNFAITHFAPWLRGKYSVISLYMLVIGYVEAVDRIAGKDLSGEIPQIQDWFKGFHDRNGYYEAMVFGRMLGGEILPLQIEFMPGTQYLGTSVNCNNIKNAWLVMPSLPVKIKCNGRLSGSLIGNSCLFSDWRGEKLLFCNVDTIMPEMKNAIDRIVTIIKHEMPDYLVSSEELNRLAEDNWFSTVGDDAGGTCFLY